MTTTCRPGPIRGLVVAGALIALAACSAGTELRSQPAVSTATTEPVVTTVAEDPASTMDPTVPSTPQTDTLPSPGAPVRSVLPVALEQVSVVDPNRPTVKNGQLISNERVLPTSIWRPSIGGPYPLVIFAHGYRLGPTSYERFCRTLASAGYIVAAPSFPLADAQRGNGVDRGDIPNEATDVSFVINALRAGPVTSDIAAGPVAVVGHSDGADVALMVGYQKAKADLRVGAVVAVAPDAMNGALVASGPPLLLIQGDQDSIVPYSNSQRVFAQVSAKRYYLTLIGADHLPPIYGGTKWTAVLDTAVALFLKATVTANGDKGTPLEEGMGSMGLSRLTTGG